MPYSAHRPGCEGEMQPQSQGAAWYSALMSKAFTKEAEGGEVYDDLPGPPGFPA